MSHTDELQKLLGELGVRYENVKTELPMRMTVWASNGVRWAAIETEHVEDDGLAVAVYKDFLTAEQVVRATVGKDVAR